MLTGELPADAGVGEVVLAGEAQDVGGACDAAGGAAAAVSSCELVKVKSAKQISPSAMSPTASEQK